MEEQEQRPRRAIHPHAQQEGEPEGRRQAGVEWPNQRVEPLDVYTYLYICIYESCSTNTRKWEGQLQAVPRESGGGTRQPAL